MNDADFPVADVLRGIDAAERAGLGPIKINMVVKRGTNDQEILPMARHFRGRDVALRFIEYMDVGATNGWRMDEVLPSTEVVERIAAEFALLPLPASAPRRDRGALALRRVRRRRRDRHDLERHAGVLQRLQPGPPVDRRQALPLPVRQPRPRPARARPRRRERRRDRGRDRPGLAAARRPLLRAAQRRAAAGAGRREARRDALHRRVSGAATIRPLGAADLADYKRLRDDMLALHPEAFTSDAESDAGKEPTDYLHRLGLERHDGGQFVLGAWRGKRLLGAIGCEREARLKVRHIGHVIGMMVRPEARGAGIGALLLEACIGEARHAGLEMLTLSVTAENAGAVRLYERHGFAAYGTLRRALKVAGRYHDKLHMALVL